MKEWLPFLITGAGVLGGVCAIGWGFITGFKKRAEIASQAVDKAHAELAEVIRLEADAWKKRYEGEHDEFITYRKSAHEHNNEANTTVLRLTTENAELRSKTDLSPVLRFHQEQSLINTKIVQSLDKIIKHLDLGNGVTP